MLLFTAHLRGTTILCRDGEAGTAKDVLFDDESWKVRYVSARLGLPLVGRKVLLAPRAFSGRAEDGRLLTALTRDALDASPSIEDDLPISREKERAIHEHFAWPVYWGGPMAIMPGSYTLGTTAIEGIPQLEPLDAHSRGDSNRLRSCDEIIGYTIHSRDGDEFGEVVDFVIDEGDWSVAFLVLDTSRWFAGKQVAAPPSWITGIDSDASRVDLGVTREVIERTEHHAGDRFGPRPSGSFGPPPAGESGTGVPRGS